MQALQAQDWKARQELLARAYEVVARMHNALQLTIPLKKAVAPYFGRPYRVTGDGRHAEELRKSVISEEVKKIDHNLGSVNQLIDSNNKINDLNLRQKFRHLYT